MEKFKMVLALLAMVILPIIGNLIFLCLFPFLCISLIFSAEKDFYKQIETFKNSIAKFN